MNHRLLRIALVAGLLAPAPYLLNAHHAEAFVPIEERTPQRPVREVVAEARGRRNATPARIRAIEQLAGYREAQSRRALERLIADRDAEIRAAAAQSLGAVGDARSIRALDRQIRREQEAWVKAQLGHARARLSGDTAIRARIRLGSVALGENVDHPADAQRIAQQGLEQLVRRLGRIERQETEPPRPDDHDASQTLRAHDGVPYLRIDAAIRSLTYTVENGIATGRVEVQISLSNDPGLMVRAVDTTTASVRAPVGRGNPERLKERILRQVIQSAIDGARRNIDGGIESVYEMDGPGRSSAPRRRRR